MKRRDFIKDASLAGFVISSLSLPYSVFWKDEPEFITLTILHTNDVHSRIEPFPMDGSRNEGLGGAAKRAGIIKKIREEQPHVMLLDAGDVFQGTPYFNFFGGEIEFKLMSAMGYDACTIGNHDFDAGIDGLEKQMIHTNFPLVISNYDFSNTAMHRKTKEYVIFRRGPLKIGVFGLGIELKGLVPEALYEETQYLNPLATAAKFAPILKRDYKCDYVICLSHLGFKYNEQKISDVLLAKESEDIDLIIGGHTHTFLKTPEVIVNQKGQQVVINQVGWAGIMLGRLDIVFERNKKGHCMHCSNTLIK